MKMNVLDEYKKHCQDRLPTERVIPFSEEKSVRSYNDSTLFCPAGMQKYTEVFKNKGAFGTVANVQPCIRLNDIDLIGDGSHLIYFNMLGLFSFRELEIPEVIKFWMKFMDRIGLKLSSVHIHPDKMMEWGLYYLNLVSIKLDKECTWSDGDIGGYCTEFYIDGIEVGNIVNTGGDCIDVGFGLERLQSLVDKTEISKEETLRSAILKIIESGFVPGPKEQGYVLRKLLNLSVREGVVVDHPFYEEEKVRMEKLEDFYYKNKEKFKDKSSDWWLDTHGVDLKLIWNKKSSPRDKKII